MEDQEVIKIPENVFSEKTRNYLPLSNVQYVNRFAYVVPVSENEIYVNIKGDCYIISSYQALDSLLISFERKKVDTISNLSVPIIDSNEINDRVQFLLNSLHISSVVIDDHVVKLVDQKIATSPGRNELFNDLYFLVGEYFCHAFKNKIIWEKGFDRDLKIKMPVLFYTDQKKYLFFSHKLNSLLVNDFVDIPLQLSIERIFLLINKDIK